MNIEHCKLCGKTVEDEYLLLDGDTHCWDCGTSILREENETNVQKRSRQLDLFSE